MEKLAYIQIQESGAPYSAHGAAACRGFELLGYEVRFFRRDEFDELPLTPETIVVGGVGTVHAALRRLGAEPPEPANLPRSLEPFWGRRAWMTSLGELRLANRYPVFVKPQAFHKLFNGGVVHNQAELERLLAPREGFPEVDEDTPLQAQEVVAFASEWRVFVIRAVVQGISHYAGDPLLFPSASVIRMAIGAYTGAPAGYAADFGVTGDGRTLLVEVNDGYSLGHGGLVADRYAQLLRARWAEMVEAAPQDR